MAPINEEHPSNPSNPILSTDHPLTLEPHPHILRYVLSDEGRHEAYSRYCPSAWHYLLVAIHCATFSHADFSRLNGAVVCLEPIKQYCEPFQLLLALAMPF